MKLPTKPAGPLRRDPKLMILFGQTKVGKTTMVSKLPEGKYLLIDTEEGSDFLTCNRVQVNSIAELMSVVKELNENAASYPFSFIVLDTIDVVIGWTETYVMMKEGVTMIKDIPYGGGYSQVREKVMSLVEQLTRLNRNIILIGHRKKTGVSAETDAKDEFSMNTLDVSGKLKNFLCADADAIGYTFRNERGELMISFRPTENVEAGARPEHLKGKVMPFKWEHIYIDHYDSKEYEPSMADFVQATV